MRRALLMGSLLVLIVAVFAMWAYRFERTQGLPTWHLADLRDDLPPMPGVEWTGPADRPGLLLRMNADGKPLAIRLAIPMAPAVDGIHLKFRMTSHGLTAGSEKWQDGRFMVEWHQPRSGMAPEDDAVSSIRDNLQVDLQDLVLLPLHGPAVPALRLEHLGRSGEFELSDLEITAVQERSIWKTGRWFLAFGWLTWAAAWVLTWPGISRWRAICASSIWVIMGMHFVIPGPWKTQRAMVPGFQLGSGFSGSSAGLSVPVGGVPEATPAEVKSELVPALGKLPDQYGFVLRVKVALANARPLLHALLLFAPSLVFVWLLGRGPALFLSVFLAISIELAQVAFGYGFDIVDVGDLASDAVGIALALWVWKTVVAKPQRR